MSKGDPLQEWLGVAEQIAVEAGELLMGRFRQDLQVEKKGPINLVTEMDLAAEELIVGRLLEHFPSHQILAEEKGSRGENAPLRWIVDPLDGTTNYAHGYRFFAVSIALEREGEIVLGVVYDPVTRELFSARRGGGARLNNEPIRVSATARLSESLLCTGFAYGREEIIQNLKLFNRLILKARAIRRDGSAALDLCYVACGRFDGFWELSLNPWDVAAGLLLVEEAGGRVSSFHGGACSIYDREIVASNGRLHQELVDLLCQPAGQLIV